MPKPPIGKAVLGHISVALFRNENDGNGGPRYSVSLQRRYWDRSKESWESTTCYLPPSDVPAAISCLRKIEATLLDLDDRASVES